jgi:glycosyltransferase involved in cell wall biosynthesis
MHAHDGTELLTVVIPVANAEKYVEDAIRSVRNQSVAPDHIIVIDDGSRDGTPGILSRFSDARMEIIRHENNRGLVASLNEGITRARTPFIARMDADDIAYPHRFDRQIEFLKRHPDVGIVGTWFRTVGRREELINYPEDHERIVLEFLRTCPIGHPTVMMRRSVLEQSGCMYREEARHSEDTDLWSRLLGHTRFANIPEVLLDYRVHDRQVTVEHAAQVRRVFDRSRERVLKHIGSTLGIDADVAASWTFFTRASSDEGTLDAMRNCFATLARANRLRQVYPQDYMAQVFSSLWRERVKASPTTLPLKLLRATEESWRPFGVARLRSTLHTCSAVCKAAMRA